ncbi:hypothetical protein SD457_11945 [Coprobacillaceae bacterium CR2/5/TPMF4]|nr:hypothetical protein SD457_11945 [Coprobacillaceae bacterium CR2/5/TPMF4]
MDYSIYDAKEAGFNKVVFVIRKDLEAEFDKVIGSRIKQVIDVEYVFQELDQILVNIKKHLSKELNHGELVRQFYVVKMLLKNLFSNQC